MIIRFGQILLGLSIRIAFRDRGTICRIGLKFGRCHGQACGLFRGCNSLAFKADNRIVHIAIIIDIHDSHALNIAGGQIFRDDGIAAGPFFGHGLATTTAARPAPGFGLVLRVFLGQFFGIGFFFGQQGLAVSDRNLVIVRVNFRKRQKTMTIPAVIDKCRLKRRFDSCDFC